MSRRMNWNARAMYIIVALVMTVGLLLVPLQASVVADPGPCLDGVHGSFHTWPDDDGIHAWMEGWLEGDCDEDFPEGLFGAEGGLQIRDSQGQLLDDGGGCFSADVEEIDDDSFRIEFRGAFELSNGPIQDADSAITDGQVCVNDDTLVVDLTANLFDDAIRDAHLDFDGRYWGIDPDGFEIEPSLALNVKGAVEKYRITYNGEDGCDYLCWWMIDGWDVTYDFVSNVVIVDGGDSGDCWISILAPGVGEAHVIVYLDFNGDGIVDLELNAEKKWGEISCTELTSESLGSNEYRATELVKADFYWGSINDTATLPADDAVISWWLMDIDALTDADNKNGGVGILDVEADLGNDPCDDDGGCGDWLWDPTLDPEDQPNDPFNRIDELQDLYPVDHSTAWLYDGSAGTSIDADLDFAENESDEDGKAHIGVYAASPRTVLLVTLAEYPIDKHGENDECVQHETFKPIIPSEQVKSPQLRWAGEKLVLEKDWGKYPYFEPGCIYEDENGNLVYVPLDCLGCHGDCGDQSEDYPDWDLVGSYFDARIYIAMYNLEEGSVGNLEPIDDIAFLFFTDPNGMEIRVDINAIGLPSGAQQVIEPLGGGFYHYFYPQREGEGGLWWDSVSEAIVCTEMSGEVDVNAALYEVGLRFEAPVGASEPYVQADVWFEGPVANHGFLAYFLEFEEVALADDITPDLVQEPGEPVDVAVQVKGFFDYRHSHLMATTRAEKLLDLDGDFVPDVILPAGRYVLPDDWWLLAGTKDVSLRPNWDMMDMADNDDITSSNELGPYDTDVRTTDPPDVAEYPCIGPFNTLQSWSSELMWITQATVPGSTADRNTVVPDGEELNWYDAPMPQALVTFKVTDYDAVVNHSLSGLDKGDLEGYGYTGSPKVYHSPFYAVEIPASPYIPAGYNWDSWGGDGPYDYWEDLGIKSFPGDPEPYEDNDQDVEVYCDNHGIAAVTVDPLDAQGSLEITATADYPYAPKKGKYGPRVSPPITIGSRTDLNPHFTPDKVEVAVGETVTFDPTSTYGGTLPYTRIRWDFEGDGVWDVDLTGSWATPSALPIATWAYSAEGNYYPCVRITDSSVPYVARTECMSDPYSIVVGAGLTQIEWVFLRGSTALIAPYPDAGRPFLVSDAATAGITVDPATEELSGIYYIDEVTGDLLFYVPGMVTSTLTTLEVGKYYYVVVTGACTLTIPQA